MNLNGKTILITRAEHQANDLAGMIKKNGGSAVTFPTIQIKAPGSWAGCDAACAQIASYHGIIFTSVNALEFFIKRYLSLNHPVQSLQEKTIFAVGDKTRQALNKHSIKVNLIPDKFTAEELAKTLTEEMIAGKLFLFPRGNLGKNTLVDHIISLKGEIQPVIVYITQKAERRNVEQIRQMLQRGKIDFITFTSPSTAKNFFELITDFSLVQKKVKLAVIGPVTASAIEKLGYKVDITAKNSTIESMIEEIKEYIALSSIESIINNQ